MRFFVDLIEQLNDAQVRYAVVGGVAVVLHGHPRFTADVDIVLAMDEPNLQRAVAVFLERGMTPRAPVPIADLADEGKRNGWIRAKGLKAFTLLDPSEPGATLDVLLDQPIEIEDLIRDCIYKPLGRATVPVASIDHLIAMKESAGRALDLADIEALRTIRND